MSHLAAQLAGRPAARGRCRGAGAERAAPALGGRARRLPPCHLHASRSVLPAYLSSPPRRTRYLPPLPPPGREGRHAVLGRKGQRVRGDEGRRVRPHPGMPRDRHYAVAGKRAAALPVRGHDGAAGRVDGRAARPEARRHRRNGRPGARRGVRPGRGGRAARRGGGRARRPPQRVPGARLWARVRRGRSRAGRPPVGGAGRRAPAGAAVLHAPPARRRRAVRRGGGQRRRARPRVARQGRRRGGPRRAGRPVAAARDRRGL